MADEQVSILITAIDDVSKKLDVIKSNIGNMAQDSVKQTQSMSNSFKETQGNILILGQAALQVNNIFDSYDNLQLRIENSNMRVTDSAKSLRDAQYNLQKVMDNSTSSARDIEHAQDNVAVSSNHLEIAQNNLQRTMNKVEETYISIGLSAMTLLASLPTLVGVIVDLTAASLTFIATPIGAVLFALGVVAAGVTLIIHSQNEELKKSKTINGEYEASLRAVTDSEEVMADKATLVANAIKSTYDAMKGDDSSKGSESIANQLKINKLLEEQAEIKSQGYYIDENGQRHTDDLIVQNELKHYQALQAQYDADDKIDSSTLELSAKLEKDKQSGQKSTFDIYKSNAQGIVDYVAGEWTTNYTKAFNDANAKVIADNKVAVQNFKNDWGAFYDIKTGKDVSVFSGGGSSGGSSGGSGSNDQTISSTSLSRYAPKSSLSITPSSNIPSYFTSAISSSASSTPSTNITTIFSGNVYASSPQDYAEAINNKMCTMLKV